MIKNFILRWLLRKDLDCIAIIYAALIIKKNKAFSQVPDILKNKVEEILKDLEIQESSMSR